ncbi:hypothetical protein [Amycolatopsis kentuckyensis]|uniref:hypothetical protein n=1 Tax=Amycolatopsis kentuckyensis TaxID=218823 RepID=UPI0035659348
MNETKKVLERIERHLKAISSELYTTSRALLGIYEMLKESNRARDKWARTVVDVLEDAKEGTNVDEDSG